jgi:hypothetical protein
MYKRGFIVFAALAAFSLPASVVLLQAVAGVPIEHVDVPVRLVNVTDSKLLVRHNRALSNEELVRSSPREFGRRALAWYTQNVREYRCVLKKQEMLDGGLSKVQEIQVLYTEDPHRVYMKWRKNAPIIQRALIADCPELRNDKGEQLVWVEPSGVLAAIGPLKRELDSPQSTSFSRVPMIEFGFRCTLEKYNRINDAAAERGELDLRFLGEGEVDGRKTWIVTRVTPCYGPGTPYFDRKVIAHFDQEWLLPIAVYCYADTEEKELLGMYIFTNIDLKPNFSENDFKF